MAHVHGERIVGTVGRVTRTDRAAAVPETCVTASNHRPTGSGDSHPASAVAPGGALAREGEAQPTPRRRTDLRSFPAEATALVVMLALSTLSISGTSRLQLSIPARARPAHGGSRRRALETVEKVVTAWQKVAERGRQILSSRTFHGQRERVPIRFAGQGLRSV